MTTLKFKGSNGAFLGRNGYGKSSGAVAFNMQGGTILSLVPLTSRGLSARASFDIPVEDVPAVADMLAPGRMKALQGLHAAAQAILDDGSLENHPKLRAFRAAVRKAGKELGQ